MALNIDELLNRLWPNSMEEVEGAAEVGPGRAGGGNRGTRLLFKIESNSGRLNHLTELWLLLLERPPPGRSFADCQSVEPIVHSAW